MGKTRNLFKKIRDNKGTLHAKMGSIKDRNVMDLRYIVLKAVLKFLYLALFHPLPSVTQLV